MSVLQAPLFIYGVVPLSPCLLVLFSDDLFFHGFGVTFMSGSDIYLVTLHFPGQYDFWFTCNNPGSQLTRHLVYIIRGLNLILEQFAH